MSDDLERFDPFAEQTERGFRGKMRPRDTGKWVRLNDVSLLRMQSENLRHELNQAQALLAVYQGGWSSNMQRVFAEAHDKEEAAQMGEPNPWALENDDEEWKRDRLACVKCGLDALIKWVHRK